MRDTIIKTYKKLHSYSATARVFNISRQRVHQIVKKYTKHGKHGRLKKYKKNLFGKKCFICKKVNSTILHHIDFDNKNDVAENLQPVCTQCHILLHKIQRDGNGWEKRHKYCVSCGKLFNYNFKHLAKGLCISCYGKQHRLKNRKYFREYFREYRRKHNKNKGN